MLHAALHTLRMGDTVAQLVEALRYKPDIFVIVSTFHILK
jgi:hypothetical protein